MLQSFLQYPPMGHATFQHFQWCLSSQGRPSYFWIALTVYFKSSFICFVGLPITLFVEPRTKLDCALFHVSIWVNDHIPLKTFFYKLNIPDFLHNVSVCGPYLFIQITFLWVGFSLLMSVLICVPRTVNSNSWLDCNHQLSLSFSTFYLLM